MTCNDKTCRVCNVDRNRLCHNEIEFKKTSLIPKMRLKLSGTIQTEFSQFGTFGKWCRNDICDIVSSGCQCKPTYHWKQRRNSK